MMDDSDQDYLTEYRVFFDEFYKSVELNNPLPVNIGKYNIAEFEITGEVISWCLEYLNARKCPSSLIAPLCRSVKSEMEEIIRRDPESCGYRANEDDYQTLKLMQATIKKLIEVCLRYSDNSKLSRLPPPPPVTPSVSASAAKNARRTMEDRHIVINDLHALFGIEGYGVASYYAVFDGHNGSDAAIYACSHIYQYLVESKYYPDNPEAAFDEAFMRADERFIDKSNKENLKSGTTVVCVLIRHDRGKAYVAWLGDSQAILVNGTDFIQLVNPHRPDHIIRRVEEFDSELSSSDIKICQLPAEENDCITDEEDMGAVVPTDVGGQEERERIESLGGSVVFWGTWRVNGQLAVSRSIGDVDYKPYVTGKPDVNSYDLTGDEDFLLLACDGLWDVVSEMQAVEKVYEYLKESKGDRSGVSKSLVTAAKSLGSRDNISVVVAWLDMSTLENGHFVQDSEDVPEDILPPVLRNLKPSPQITAAPQRLDENAEEWLKTLPWSYADVLRKPAPKKDEPAPVSPPKPEPVLEPVEVVPEDEEPVEVVPEDEEPIKGEDSGDVAGEADSGEDSDEEWNYISGKENRQPNQQQKEELSREDMESQLNPNAAEFVPVYGAGNEPDIASSPQKGMERSLEDISIPTANDFFKEICKRPSDIGDIGENETSINGDALENLSTKAVFGDDSACLNNTVDSWSSSEPLKDTNPFAESQVPNFVKEHFSKDHFSLPDIEFKPFPQSGQESEINFMTENDKPDLLSPCLPPSAPKMEVEANNVNDVSDITFGDGVNVEEIIRSKQDSPLLRESPEPGLEPGNENDIDVTPENETVDKISEFSSNQGVTVESENTTTSIAGLSDIVSSHQGPETSVDSEPEQDDVLVCPMKKEQNGIGHDENKIEETDSSDVGNDFMFHFKRDLNQENIKETDIENKFVSHKDEEDLFINDENVCCFRQTVKTSVQIDESEDALNNSLDKPDFAKEIVQKQQTDVLDKVPEPLYDGISIQEIIDFSAISVPTKESLVKEEEPNIDPFEQNEVGFEIEATESSTQPSHIELPEPAEEPSHTDISETNNELYNHEVFETNSKASYGEIPEPKDESLPHTNVLEHNEVSDHSVAMELTNGVSFNQKQIEEVWSDEEDVVNAETQSEEIKPIDDIPSGKQNISNSGEDVVTSSTVEEPLKDLSCTKTPIADDVCVKQEVHEELICPVKLSPLTKEVEAEGLLETESKLITEQEFIKPYSKLGDESTVNVEDQIERVVSPLEKEEKAVKLEDLVCPVRQEEDIVCPFKPKAEATLPVKEVDLPSSEHKYVQSYMFGTSETSYIDTGEKLEDNFQMNNIGDSILIDSNEKVPVDLICSLRTTPEEEKIIRQESEDAVQNSSPDEPFTDEMSSSMIDHGEEKTLPEAQSNQLDLVQELQFEVQEKQTEADTESDSGFEIINASEASTIEMELRYQSEKEAGAINEKLLMDRNEAEPLEKTEFISEEIESSFVSNDVSLEKVKSEEIIVAHKEDAVTEALPNAVHEPLASPAEPEPITRKVELEPLERTDMVNGTDMPATPPATPGPGIEEETKEGLIAAAVAAAGVATAVVAGSAAVAVSESKVEEKKALIKKTDSPAAKAGAAAKTKVTAVKAAPAKAPTSKPSTPLSKPPTPSSKPTAKATSPTTKAATTAKTSTLAAKTTTATASKVGAKPASKPSTPTGAKPTPSAASAATKPKPAAPAAAKTAVSKTATTATAAKKPTATSATTTKASPSATAKPAAAKPAASSVAKTAPSKPAAAKPTASSAAAKPPASKPGAAKLTATSTTKAPPTSPRPISARSTASTTAPSKPLSSTMTKPPAKLAPAKTTTMNKPPTSTTQGSKPAAAAKPPAKATPAKAAPAAPLNKKPAAPTAIKKPTAPTDKSAKEATNKLTAKTALTKKIEEKKVISKKEVIGENEEPPAQVAIVTTTNGHISLIENGIPSTEIVSEGN